MPQPSEGYKSIQQASTKYIRLCTLGMGDTVFLFALVLLSQLLLSLGTIHLSLVSTCSNKIKDYVRAEQRVNSKIHKPEDTPNAIDVVFLYLSSGILVRWFVATMSNGWSYMFGVGRLYAYFEMVFEVFCSATQPWRTMSSQY